MIILPCSYIFFYRQDSPRERCCLGQGVPTQCLAGCQQNSTAIQSRSQGGSTCANHVNKIMRCHRNEGKSRVFTYKGKRKRTI